MKLIPYPQYKDSGIEWLGEVPEEWGIIRTDSVTTYIRSQINPEDIKSELVFHYSIPVVQDTGTGQLEPTEDLGSAKQLITKKAILVSKLNPRKATICIAEPQDEVTICSSEFVAMKATKCDIEYLYYLVNSEKNRQRLDASVQSVTRSHQRVYPSDIYKFWTALPNWEDQQAIAAFLDRETSRIDALIQKKERLIELLKEKRIALITQAVTKGLDPTVPMKDSGIEWLGVVPEQWGIQKLKHVSNYMVSNVDKKTQEGETIIRLFNYTDVYNNEFLTNEMDLMVASAPAGQLDNFIVNTDDVLITKDSEDWRDIAKPALVKTTAPDILCGYHLALIRPINNISIGKYLFRALQSALINQQFQIASNGVTRYGLPKSAIGESLITMPPFKEQQEIASHIDQETFKIDNLTSKIINSISLLREYRSSLINAAVTGKIDLREAL